MVVLGGTESPGKHAHAVVCTGPVELRSSRELDPPAADAILRQLREAVHGRDAPRGWEAAAEQVCTISTHYLALVQERMQVLAL